MLAQLLAGALLVFVLWSLFRFAMGLRAAKALRDAERDAHQALGRRVVAELPLDGGVLLFLESGDGFYWAGRDVGKERLAGARLLLKGGVLATCSRPDAVLPALPETLADDDGSEQWSVRLYLADGGQADVPCGRLREGVSREAARAVFEAARAALAGASSAPRG